MSSKTKWLLLLLAPACEAFSEPPAVELPDQGGSSSVEVPVGCGSYKGSSYYSNQPYYADLYAWIGAEDKQLLADHGLPFFDRFEGDITALDEIAREVDVAKGNLIPALDQELSLELQVKEALLGDGASVLAAWPFAYANFATEGSQDHLLQVRLRPEAWIAVDLGGELTVYNSTNTPIALDQVLDEPHRLAGLVRVSEPMSRKEFESGESPDYQRVVCSRLAISRIVLKGDRSYFLSNPLMIESFSIDSRTAFDELKRQTVPLVLYLEEMRRLNEPTFTIYDPTCQWAAYGPSLTTGVPTCVQGYVSSLASDDLEFKPTVRNFVSLIDALDAIVPGDPVEIQLSPDAAGEDAAGGEGGETAQGDSSGGASRR